MGWLLGILIVLAFILFMVGHPLAGSMILLACAPCATWLGMDKESK